MPVKVPLRAAGSGAPLCFLPLFFFFPEPQPLNNESILDGQVRRSVPRLHVGQGDEKLGHPVQIPGSQTLRLSVPLPSAGGGERRRFHVSSRSRKRAGASARAWFPTRPLLSQSLRVGQREENRHPSRELPDVKIRRHLRGRNSQAAGQKGACAAGAVSGKLKLTQSKRAVSCLSADCAREGDTGRGRPSVSGKTTGQGVILWFLPAFCSHSNLS